MPRKRRLFGLYALLALVALGVVVAVTVATSQSEREKVRAAFEQLRQTCEDGHLGDAYLMMTQGYRRRVSLEKFWKQGGPGKMFTPDATGWIVFSRCDVWSESDGLIIGYVWAFKKEDGVWRCDGHGDTWFLD